MNLQPTSRPSAFTRLPGQTVARRFARGAPDDGAGNSSHQTLPAMYLIEVA